MFDDGSARPVKKRAVTSEPSKRANPLNQKYINKPQRISEDTERSLKQEIALRDL